MPHFVRESNIEISFTELKDSEVGRQSIGDTAARSEQSEFSDLVQRSSYTMMNPFHQHMLEIDSPLYELQSGE